MATARALPILMYHHVSPQPGLVTVSPEHFRDQMRWLARHGWHTVTTAELEGFLAGRPLPPKSVMITFDDGYLDNFIHAFPLLREYGHRAVVFAITGLIGEGPPRAGKTCPDHKTCKRLIAGGRADEVMLRWSEIEAMEKTGLVEIHSHTHSHRRWDLEYPEVNERLARLAEDLARSRATLEARLGRSSRHLCWPWGHTEAGYEETAVACGYAFHYGVRRGTVTAATHATALPRLAARDTDARWLARQCTVYASPGLARLYEFLRPRT
ncbi:MAG: polysaccharide deacetylase family protein [Burkholderiales bacterium]